MKDEDRDVIFSSKEIQDIQSELISNKNFKYMKAIEVPFKNEMENWIKKEYPSLISEALSILNGANRRLRYELRKTTITNKQYNISDLMAKHLEQECEISIPNDKNRNKNLGITKGEFNLLLSQMKKGDESLVEKVYLKQFKKAMTFLIRKYNASYDEAYESTIEALLDIRKDFLKERITYGNLENYFNRRASLIYFKLSKKKLERYFELNNEHDYPDNETVSDEINNYQLRVIIKSAIDKLGEECRGIIKQFYYDDLMLNEIAIRLDKSHAALRKQISRCRDTLRTHISKDFYYQYVSNNG